MSGFVFNQGFLNSFYAGRTFSYREIEFLYNLLISSSLTEFFILITMNWTVVAQMISFY